MPGSKRAKLQWLLAERRKAADWKKQSNVTQKHATGPSGPTQVDDWLYESRIKLATEIVARTTTPYREDQLTRSGHLQTTYRYQIAKFKQGIVCTNGTTHLSVFDGAGLRQDDFSTRKYATARWAALLTPMQRLPFGVDRSVSGLSACLYGNVENTAGNYGHWLVDGLSRLFLITRFYPLDSFDHFIVPRLRYDFQRESLLALGIPLGKLVELDPLDVVSFEHLICTSTPRGKNSSVVPGWMIDDYRQALFGNNEQSQPVKRARRLYVSRRDANSRKFTNEATIIAALERRGFDSVELSKYDFAGKVKLFAEAECVVSLTGAGLTNLMFCPSGICMLELLPDSYINYFYTTIGAHLDFHYRYIIFKSRRVLSRLNRYYGNYYLDVSRIEAALDEAGVT
ncbi:MAG: glycosyltransferase family 61 protein [Granulosicoccus sp.]